MCQRSLAHIPSGAGELAIQSEATKTSWGGGHSLWTTNATVRPQSQHVGISVGTCSTLTGTRIQADAHAHTYGCEWGVSASASASM